MNNTFADSKSDKPVGLGKQVVMLLAKPYSVDTRVRNEAETLVSNGYNVTVLSWDRSRREPIDANINGVRVLSIKLLGGSDLFAAKKARSLSKSSFALSAILLQFYSVLWCLNNLRDNYIIHANDFNTLPAGVVLKLAYSKRVKLVYDCHELTPSVYRDWYGIVVGGLVSALEEIQLDLLMQS